MNDFKQLFAPSPSFWVPFSLTLFPESAYSHGEQVPRPPRHFFTSWGCWSWCFFSLPGFPPPQACLFLENVVLGPGRGVGGGEEMRPFSSWSTFPFALVWLLLLADS